MDSINHVVEFLALMVLMIWWVWWLLMLAKGDSYDALCAINTGYLRLVNSDDAIFQAGDVTVNEYRHTAH